MADQNNASSFFLNSILVQGQGNQEQQPTEPAVMIHFGDVDASEEFASSDNEEVGCKSKRSLKAASKQAANISGEALPIMDAVTENDTTPTGSKRQRPQSPKAEFSKYHAKTL